MRSPCVARLVTCALVLILAGSAHADVFFDRAFGVDVDPGGDASFENCTTDSGCKSGSAVGDAGALSAPTGVAVDAQGRILVVETAAHRVSRFVVAADGTVSFDRAFGVGVVPGGGGGFENCTAAPPGCQAGTASGIAGGMKDPGGIAVDGAGRILVADGSFNHRVSRFVVNGDGSVSLGKRGPRAPAEHQRGNHDRGAPRHERPSRRRS